MLVVQAQLAAETVSHYGDNGLPKESAEVLAAAKAAGPVPFEPPSPVPGPDARGFSVDAAERASRPRSRLRS